MTREKQVDRLSQAIKDNADAEYGTQGPWGRLYEQEARESAARLDSIQRNSTDEERAAASDSLLRPWWRR